MIRKRSFVGHETFVFWIFFVWQSVLFAKLYGLREHSSRGCPIKRYRFWLKLRRPTHNNTNRNKHVSIWSVICCHKRKTFYGLVSRSAPGKEAKLIFHKLTSSLLPVHSCSLPFASISWPAIRMQGIPNRFTPQLWEWMNPFGFALGKKRHASVALSNRRWNSPIKMPLMKTSLVAPTPHTRPHHNNVVT